MPRSAAGSGEPLPPGWERDTLLDGRAVYLCLITGVPHFRIPACPNHWTLGDGGEMPPVDLQRPRRAANRGDNGRGGAAATTADDADVGDGGGEGEGEGEGDGEGEGSLADRGADNDDAVTRALDTLEALRDCVEATAALVLGEPEVRPSGDGGCRVVGGEEVVVLSSSLAPPSPIRLAARHGSAVSRARVMSSDVECIHTCGGTASTRRRLCGCIVSLGQVQEHRRRAFGVAGCLLLALLLRRLIALAGEVGGRRARARVRVFLRDHPTRAGCAPVATRRRRCGDCAVQSRHPNACSYVATRPRSRAPPPLPPTTTVRPPRPTNETNARAAGDRRRARVRRPPLDARRGI